METYTFNSAWRTGLRWKDLKRAACDEPDRCCYSRFDHGEGKWIEACSANCCGSYELCVCPDVDEDWDKDWEEDIDLDNGS